MVSPELLRRYPFFAGCSPAQLDAIADLCDEVAFDAGALVLFTGHAADYLYILTSGALDLHYTAQDERTGEVLKSFFVSQIDVGEPFGISALIAPHRYVGDIRTARASQAIRIDGAGLRDLCVSDSALDNVLLRRMLEATIGRLNDTRVMLVASRD